MFVTPLDVTPVSCPRSSTAVLRYHASCPAFQSIPYTPIFMPSFVASPLRRITGYLSLSSHLHSGALSNSRGTVRSQRAILPSSSSHTSQPLLTSITTFLMRMSLSSRLLSCSFRTAVDPALVSQLSCPSSSCFPIEIHWTTISVPHHFVSGDCPFCSHSSSSLASPAVSRLFDHRLEFSPDPRSIFSPSPSCKDLSVITYDPS